MTATQNGQPLRASGLAVTRAEDVRESRLTLDADVVIVGSGAGGAVTGYELARRGKKVVILEAGPYIPSKDFTERFTHSLETLYQDHGGQTNKSGDLLVLQGACVLAMAAAVWWLQGLAAGLAIVGLLVVFSLGRGFCSVAMKDVQGKCIPKARRGRLTGLASTLSGVATLAVATWPVLRMKMRTSVVPSCAATRPRSMAKPPTPARMLPQFCASVTIA